MPQLPSGLRVGLCADPVLDMARSGNFSLSMGFLMGVKEPKDMAPLINVVYFEPGEGVPEPGKPKLSGLSLSDIGTEKCNWSKEDIKAFESWAATEAQQAWILNAYEELRKIIHSVPPQLPDNLKGLFD